MSQADLYPRPAEHVRKLVGQIVHVAVTLRSPRQLMLEDHDCPCYELADRIGIRETQRGVPNTCV
jgi:hypothetical protein